MSESGGILVKPGVLNDAGLVLRDCAKTVQVCIDQVDSEMQALGPDKFSGEAADSIRAKYARMRDLFYSFKPVVERIADNLTTISQTFEGIDDQLANNGGTK